MAIVPAFEKLERCGWLVSFWTTRPKRQTYNIIKTLKEAGIWERAQMLCGTPLLLNNSELPDNGTFSPATEKLTLFEKVYGRLGGEGWWLAAIEAEPLEASILQAYTGSHVTVHISPRIWLKILVAGSEAVDNLLWLGCQESGPVTVNRAS
jgi:hypothetical protein